MINDNTILSSFDDKPTLLEWLKKVEDALKTDTAKSISVENPSANTYVFKITFADGTTLSSGNVVFPDSVKDVSIKNGHIIVTQISGTQTDLGAINPYADTIVENASTNTTEIGNNVEVGGDLSVQGSVVGRGIVTSIGRLTANGGMEVHGQGYVNGTLGVTGNATIGGTITAGGKAIKAVEANPTGEATQTLEKVKIGDVAYKVGGGGGGITKRSLTIPKSELSLGGDLTEDGKHKALVLSETARSNFVSFIEGTSVEECAFVKLIIRTNAELTAGVYYNIALNLNKSVTDYGISYIGSNIDFVTLAFDSFYLFVNDTFDKNVAYFQNSKSYFDGVFNMITALEIVEYIM